MKKGFYAKLALSGIKKNKKMYKPYIFTCIGMVMMFYIITSLANSSAFDGIRGATALKSTLSFGVDVIGIFSLIFLFYTNSFLIRKRKKEFGLYNILGMSKKNISTILLHETFMLYIISIVAGLFFGIVLSKFAELALLNVMEKDINYILSISFEGIWKVIWVFAIIFALILLNSLRQIHLSNPINLLRSENSGEKPPKANWVFAIIGLLMLGYAYYLAVTIESPLAALMMFFVAVILVILATYVLFITGSVAFCRLLQKNKKYYYKSNHFVSVSSMVYRMKRNGAGLASICILSTMVLVMISSTACLYIGSDDSFNSMFPKDIITNIRFSEREDFNKEDIEKFKGVIDEAAKNDGSDVIKPLEYISASTYGFLSGDYIELDVTQQDSFNVNDAANVYQIYYVSLSDYNRIMNKNETLNNNEALIFNNKIKYDKNTITVGKEKPLKIKKQIDEIFDDGISTVLTVPSMYIVVPNIYDCTNNIHGLTDYRDNPLLEYKWFYAFNLSVDDEAQISIGEKVFDKFEDAISASEKSAGFSVTSRAESKSSTKINYGGFFFLGIILSIVFLFATVLMIYYKQVSEGYEDCSKFDIMQKVGMTKREIRKSINSQILTVFILPIITAGIHLLFAFPILNKLLQLFYLYNTSLLIYITIGCFIIFTILYTFVYRLTSNAYYSIVSGAENRD